MSIDKLDDDLLLDYLDGVLDETRQREIEAVLERLPAVQARVEQLQSLQGRLQATFKAANSLPAPRKAVWDGIVRRIARPRLGYGWHWQRLGIVFPIALGLLMLALLALLFGNRRLGDRNPSIGVPPTPISGTPVSVGTVDVGGYRLAITCMGKGSPTVILDAGANDFSRVWGLILRKTGQFTRACAYDRAGLGASDPGPTPRTSMDIVHDLQNLLTNSGNPGPYILVGHGFGGINMRLFASEYPDQVVGMVLIDPQHEDIMERVRAVLPPETPGECEAVAGFRRPLQLSAEGVNWSASAAQVRGTKPLGAMPLVVLSRGTSTGAPSCLPPAFLERVEQLVSDSGKEIAGLSTAGKQIIADKSGHFIQLDQPDLVINAIRETVELARKR